MTDIYVYVKPVTPRKSKQYSYAIAILNTADYTVVNFIFSIIFEFYLKNLCGIGKV